MLSLNAIGSTIYEVLTTRKAVQCLPGQLVIYKRQTEHIRSSGVNVKLTTL